jgi:hypothetical protein
LNVTWVNRAILERWGIDAVTLYNVRVEHPATGESVQYSCLEPFTDVLTPPEGGRWLQSEEWPRITVADPLHREALEVWFREVANGPPPPLLPWWGLGWHGEARAWVDAQLDRLEICPLGPLKQERCWFRSTVHSLETDAGRLYFKASPPAFAHEAALTEALGEWNPRAFPRCLAVDRERSWLLMRDAGGPFLDELTEIGPWEEAVRAYARLQIASIDGVEDLLRLCPDLRLDRIREGIGEFVRTAPLLLRNSPCALDEAERSRLPALVPYLHRVCKEASRYAIPPTLEHGDFGASNVQVTPNGPLYFDWSDGCISHPFFGIATFLDDWEEIYEKPGVVERLREAYLLEWFAFEPVERCRELLDLLKPLRAFHMEHYRMLKRWRAQADAPPPSPFSGHAWALRSEQECLGNLLRELLRPFMSGKTPP